MNLVLRRVEQIVRGLWFMPIIIGVLGCLLMTGGPMLWPGNVQWLVHGDLAQSYLGWAFYRDGAWTLPPGSDPLYGAGLHTSIYYSDSIPLLALFFKPFASWLPVPFQYFGLWVLACFILQAVFAWRLLGLATSSRLVKGLGSFFFVLAPPMLLRLGGHMALVGHWIVLAAIYLCLRPTRQRQSCYWAVLLVVAITVHAYLFAIAAAIWLADLVQRYWVAPGGEVSGRLSGVRRGLPEVLMVGAFVVFAAWLTGFFMVSGHGMQTDGFGYYKMNVLAPLNGAGWSRFGLNFPQAAGEGEGFNYLGVGGMALILSAVWMRVLRRGVSYRGLIPRPLLVMAVLLAIAAITCHIGIGTLQWQMPMPQKWWAALSHMPLQSTGRLFWATYYVWLLAALFVVLRMLSWRRQVLLLCGAVVLQCLDLYPGVMGLHSLLLARSREGVIPGLHGAFWDAAGSRYKTLRILPLTARPVDWEPFAFYANSHHMGTDIVQLARIDMDRFLSLYNDQQGALLSDRLDLQTLYVLDDREVDVARAAIPASHAALFRLDTLNVLAPGWSAPLPAGAIDLRGAAAVSTSYALPFESDFSAGSAARRLLGEGWDATGAGDATTLSDTASLFVPGGDQAAHSVHVELSLHRASVGKSMAQQLEVWLEGQSVGACDLAGDGCRHLAFDLPPAKQGDYFSKLELRPAQPLAKLRIVLDRVRVQ